MFTLETLKNILGYIVPMKDKLDLKGTWSGSCDSLF